MDELSLYNSWKSVPKEAQKPINAGRLKGMTDIAPMWRIQQLTSKFGPCGFGWVAPVTKSWIDEGADGQKVCNVEIELRYKYNGEWSEGVYGIGGSQLVAKEKSGLYTDDEAYKKAYTDAISVACKSLGMGADVYWGAGSKYTDIHEEPKSGDELPTYKTENYADRNAREALFAGCGNDTETYNAMLKKYGVTDKKKIPMSIYNKMYKEAFETQEKLPWE